MIQRFLSIFLVMVMTSIVGCSEPTTSTSAVDDGAELMMIDVAVGPGAEAVEGKKVSVHYTGWLYDKAAGENCCEKLCGGTLSR